MKNKKIIIIIIVAVVLICVILFIVLPKIKSNKQTKQDEELKAKLTDKKAVAEVPTKSEYESYFPIKKGDNNSWVKMLQKAMIDKYGFATLPKYGADGIYGNETEAALIKLKLPTTIYLSTFYKLLNIK